MFVGMDVHRNRTQVCVMDNKGNEVRNRNVVNDRRLLATELSGLKKGHRSRSRRPTAPGGWHSSSPSSASRPTWRTPPDAGRSRMPS